MYLTLEFHLITNASVITTHPLVLPGLTKRSRKRNCESLKKAETCSATSTCYRAQHHSFFRNMPLYLFVI